MEGRSIKDSSTDSGVTSDFAVMSLRDSSSVSEDTSDFVVIEKFNNDVNDPLPSEQVASQIMPDSSELPNFEECLPLKKKNKKKIPLSITELPNKNKLQQTVFSTVYPKTEKKPKINESAASLAEPQITEVSLLANLNLSKELGDLEIDLNFEGTKKKKSKSIEDKKGIEKNKISERELPVVERLISTCDSDYTYEFLLSRFYRMAQENRPNSETSSAKLVVKPPQVFRVGCKKTNFANFIEICRILHRSPQHAMSFLLTELGTSGSFDGNNHLIIKGRFQQKQIENVIRHYIKEYVRCLTCSSVDTVLRKENRLNFLICEKCQSRCSVTNIKSGFQAVTGKRAAIRAKAVSP